jgi:uncharacterized membrane protein
VNRQLPLLIRHVIYNLRGGFLIRPLAIALTLGSVGAILSWLEETVPAFSSWMPAVLFPSHEDPQVAQVILGGIAGSIMTVVSIVFAILLMTLTLASMQFSPRIIVSFARDRVTQWTLGIFLGTFCYCMAALPSARALPKPFAPVVTVLGAMLLALVCVGWLLFFIHHISHAISVSHIVDRIASETEAMIDEMMPWPRRYSGQTAPAPTPHYEWDTTVLSDASGYIRFIDIGRLVSLAKTHHVKLQAVRGIGLFVPAETPLLLVNKGDRLTPDAVHDLRRSFDLGPSRTLQQDVEFGILQIVDIALKAISPAVNDPSTAINCVDQLSRIMIRFVSREPPEGLLYDPPGIFRVSIPWTDFDHLLTSAFEQIRMYAKADPAVSLRMLRALADIAISCTIPPVRARLYALGKRIVDGCGEKLGQEEMDPLRRRMISLENVTVAATTEKV